MKSLVCAFIGVVGCAAAANADFLTLPTNAPHFDTTNANITSEPMSTNGGSGGVSDAGGPAQYSSIPGPYAAFAVANFAQRDDYTSISAGSFLVDAFRFVGGVNTAGMSLDVLFLDNATPTPNVVSGFSITLPTGGSASIWTITFGLNDPLALASGQVQIQSHSATDTGRWWLTTTAASPGSNSFATGSGSQLVPPQIQAFEMQVPAPGSLALLGLGGLAAMRRRR